MGVVFYMFFALRNVSFADLSFYYNYLAIIIINDIAKKLHPFSKLLPFYFK